MPLYLLRTPQLVVLRPITALFASLLMLKSHLLGRVHRDLEGAGLLMQLGLAHHHGFVSGATQ